MHALSSITHSTTIGKHARNRSSIDPFVIKGSPSAWHVTNMSSPNQPSNISAIRPLRLSRTNSLLKDSQPLKPRSGDNQSLGSSFPPQRTGLMRLHISDPPLELDFHWPVAELPVMPPPPPSLNRKGHKRSKTVRLSDQLIQSSIITVPEEMEENEKTPPRDAQLEKYKSRASNASSYTAADEIFDMYSSPTASRSASRSPSRGPTRYKKRSASDSSLGSARSNTSNIENQTPSPTLRPS